MKTSRGHAGVGFSSSEREQNDFYPTPASAVSALLDVERFQGTVLEPCCGNGAISKVLESAGYRVRSTDLFDRGFGERELDFLSAAYQYSAENIITNPPYKLAFEFVEKSLTITTGKVAMLLRLAFLETERRRQLFESTPLAHVHVFSRRITMHPAGVEFRGKQGMIAFAWFVWDHSYSGKPMLSWI